MPDKNQVWNIAKNVMKYTNPLTFMVIEGTEKAIEAANNIAKKGNIDELEQEAKRQAISLKMAESQAKVAQEISIARRIDTAEEVAIEEFYDTSGEGKVGIKLEGESIFGGISGSGKHVTKRIYTFKGWRDGGLDTIEKLTDKDKEQ